MNLYVLLCAALLASHALCVEPAPPTSLRPLPASVDANLLRIFFVGDTHGDSYCAKEWIQRTGLVDFSQQPWKWTGAETDAIVFLGDYVDKVRVTGVHSCQQHQATTMPKMPFTLLAGTRPCKMFSARWVH